MPQQPESRLKNIGISMLVPIGGVAVLFLVALMLRGMVWVSEKTLPWLLTATKYTIGICIFVLLPLCIFRKVRPYVGVAFGYASLVFTLMLWAYSCLFAFDVWGYGGLIVGLVFMGLGVVAVAFLAALLHAQWWVVLDLIVGVFLSLGTHLLGAWLSEMRSEEGEQELLVPDVE